MENHSRILKRETEVTSGASNPTEVHGFVLVLRVVSLLAVVLTDQIFTLKIKWNFEWAET